MLKTVINSDQTIHNETETLVTEVTKLMKQMESMKVMEVLT